MHGGSDKFPWFNSWSVNVLWPGSQTGLAFNGFTSDDGPCGDTVWVCTWQPAVGVWRTAKHSDGFQEKQSVNAGQLPPQPIITPFVNAVYARDNWTRFLFFFRCAHVIICSGLTSMLTKQGPRPALPGWRELCCLCVSRKRRLGDVHPLFGVIFSATLLSGSGGMPDSTITLQVPTFKAGLLPRARVCTRSLPLHWGCQLV